MMDEALSEPPDEEDVVTQPLERERCNACGLPSWNNAIYEWQTRDCIISSGSISRQFHPSI